MSAEILDWLQLLLRWVHITTGVTWIGTSIFFMWLDRSFEKKSNQGPGHVGELWMVHGGGFYQVQKLEMGSVEVPKNLHWFKWESYWTWMSGFFLMSLIFFTGSGTFLLDSSVSGISFVNAVALSLGTIFGSWIFYDTLWESSLAKNKIWVGHLLTVVWYAVVVYVLCRTLSGRAAYLLSGALLGTWMTANVFMRIIPRQVKMVEAAKRGEAVNAEWSKNAKNRSTHNTYFTLPVIFIMLSNHFPATYGHHLNWLILLVITAGGAAVREYFILRLAKPRRAVGILIAGIALVLAGIGVSQSGLDTPEAISTPTEVPAAQAPEAQESSSVAQIIPNSSASELFSLKGSIDFVGTLPPLKKLNVPAACITKPGQTLFSDELVVNNKKLANVLVHIVQGHENLSASPASAESVEIDQRSCVYRPRVTTARVGQKVVFINSDPVFHNVKSLAKQNPNFNLAMPRKDQRETRIFEKEEIFQTKCNVHPWMTVNLGVFNHSFYALSDKNGNFEIKGLKPGSYKVEFWHEVLGAQGVDVLIENADKIVNVNFKKE